MRMLKATDPAPRFEGAGFKPAPTGCIRRAGRVSTSTSRHTRMSFLDSTAWVGRVAGLRRVCTADWG